MTIPRCGAHLWLAEPASSDEQLLVFESDLLSNQERGRAAKFVFGRDRRLYVFAHAFLRIVLSKYLDRPPRSIHFTANAHGRPELDWKSDNPPLRFNLAHTAGLTACVVSRSADCGVDAECIDRRIDYVQLAPAVLAAAEIEHLETLPPDAARRRFFEIWTLKEAYVKARGVGLAFPIRSISFPDFGIHPFCRFAGDGDNAAQWQFWSGIPSDKHCYAVALHTGIEQRTLDIFEATREMQEYCRR